MLQNFYPCLCPYFVIKAKPSLLTRTKSLNREQTSTLLSTTCQEKINFDPCILILLYLTLKLADFKQHRTQSIYTAHSSVLVFFISSFRKSTRHLGESVGKLCWHALRHVLPLRNKFDYIIRRNFLSNASGKEYALWRHPCIKSLSILFTIRRRASKLPNVMRWSGWGILARVHYGLMWMRLWSMEKAG